MWAQNPLTSGRVCSMRPLPEKTQTTLVALMLCACEPFGPGAGDLDTLDTPGEGRMELEPSALDFGEVSPLEDGPVSLTLTVRNSGSGELKVAGLDRVLGDSAFSTDADALLKIPAGGREEILVTFAPTTDGPFEGTLFPNGQETVDLIGEGFAPVSNLQLLDELDADLPVGCRRSLTAILTNDGREPLEVTDSYTTGSEAFSITSPEVASLAPNEETTLEITVAPLWGGIHSGVAAVSSNDPHTPATAVQLELLAWEGSRINQVETLSSDTEIGNDGDAIIPLLEVPVVETIALTSSGETIDLWSYLDDRVAIRVDHSAAGLSLGDTLTIDYLAAVACE